ncbi:MAG: SRPBCC family protein [Deltaproteobacteria bacterium]|nr:SRPBCC family protein [Deltaproteobacteria bacterium]MBW2419538.1 SRPBCC family protein [Deltaproteobacteria bacterium]
MIQVSVSGEISAPVDALWKVIADFGAVGWMQGIDRVEVTGEGVGMVRAIYAGGGDTPVLEELESLDEDARRLGYTIPKNNPMPVSSYRAAITAVDLGGGKSRLDWAASFDPAPGAEEAAAKATVEGMYGVLIGWVKAEVEGG